MIYAVIDTNVLVSAMITHDISSPTLKVVQAIGKGRIVPLYDDEIMREYKEVLSRDKFGLVKARVARLLKAMKDKGVAAQRVASGEVFLDASDAVFYEVAMSKDGAYLVTGNKKHFPVRRIVVTPAEMVEILRIANT